MDNRRRRDQRPGAAIFNKARRGAYGAIRQQQRYDDDDECDQQMSDAGDGNSFRGGRGMNRGMRRGGPGPQGIYSRGALRGRGGPTGRYPSGPSRNTPPPPSHVDGIRIKVSGYPEGSTFRDVTDFLKSQSPVQWRYIAESNQMGPRRFSFSVGSREEADALLSMTGVRMRGFELIVEEERGFVGGGRGVVRPVAGNRPLPSTEALTSAIRGRYNSEGRFLNLSALATQAELQTSHVDLNSRPLLIRLLRVLKQECSQVTAIDMSSNSIRSLVGLQDLHDTTPSLENLSLGFNAIRDLKELDFLKQIQFRELIFVDNPISKLPSYETDVTSRFKSLKFLDQKPVKPVISFNVPEPVVAVVLPPVSPSYCSDQGTGGLAQTFISRFYHCYDNDRQALLNVYTDRSMFSVTLEPSPPGPGSLRDRDQNPLLKYMRYNRNLSKVDDLNVRTSLLYVGRLDIVNCFAKMPPTGHLADTFVVDAIVLDHISNVPLLQLSVHGAFTEGKGSDETRIFFDRVFLLCPPPPQTSVLSDTWPALIVNDHVHLRRADKASASPRPFPVVQPSATPAAPPAASPSPTLVPHQQTAEWQEVMVQQFCGAAGVNTVDARNFLTSCHWDPAEASSRWQQMQAAAAAAAQHQQLGQLHPQQ